MPSRLRGPLGKEVQDELGAVYDLEFGKIRDGAHLGGAEFGVEHQHVGPSLQGLDDQFRKFALAHQEPGVEPGAALDDGGRYVKTGGTGQLRQFCQGILGGGAVGPGDPDQDGPFPAAARPGGGQAGKFGFQGSHQGFKIQLESAHLPGLDDGPIMAIHRLRQEMRDLEGAGLTIGGAEHRHCIQAQQGQVHEIILAQGAGVQVGVDQPKALEAAFTSPLPRQGRNEQALGVPDDDVGHRALAVHQDPDLPAELPGNLGQLPGQFRGEHLGRRHLAAV